MLKEDGQTTMVLTPLAQVWCGGEVASADGLRFVVSVHRLHAGWNHCTSDQFSGCHGSAIAGTLRDSLFVLAGLLEQQTRLVAREIMTDTHGFSEVVFGLFALLSYRFIPRDLLYQRFWRLEKDDYYGPLNELGWRSTPG